MSPHRDFDAARAERLKGREPITFTMGGQSFACVVEPALGDALALAEAPEPDDSPSAALKAMLRFIEASLDPADRRRFRRMTVRQTARRLRRRAPVSSQEVFELGVMIASSYSARPSQPSAGSAGGRSSSATSSRPSPSAEQDATSQSSG